MAEHLSDSDNSTGLPIGDRLVDFDYVHRQPGYLTFVFWVICLFGIWHVVTNIYVNESGLWQNCIHFAGFGLLGAITTAGSKKSDKDRWLLANILFGTAIALSALWVAFAENGIYERTLAETGQSWQCTIVDWAAGFIVVIGAIEMTRRLTGWIIPVLVVLSLSYLSLIHI